MFGGRTDKRTRYFLLPGYMEPPIPDNDEKEWLEANPEIWHKRNCIHCQRYDQMLREGESTESYGWTKWYKHCEDIRSRSACTKYGGHKPTHKGNGRHKGLWAGTLTMSPTDDKSQEDMIAAIKKLMRQKSCPVKRYVWYLEYTQAGLPHVHFLYETETGGRIERKHFKRVWSLWDEDSKCGAGFRGGYHRECHSEAEYLVYVQKDNSPVHENCWELKSDD